MIEPQWLTYREAAERLGITADAVARRARRRQWPKLLPNRPGNPIRIQVPGDQFHRPPPPALPPPSDRSPPVDTDLTAALAERQAEVARLGDLAERERRIAAIERRDRLEPQRQTDDLLAQIHAAARGRPRPLRGRRVGPRPGRCRPADRRPRAPDRGGASSPEEARAALVATTLLIRRRVPPRGGP